LQAVLNTTYPCCNACFRITKLPIPEPYIEDSNSAERNPQTDRVAWVEVGRGPPVEVKLDLESGPGAARTAREELRSRLQERLPAEYLLSLLLVVSELVTNSARHGPGKPIRLRVRVNDDDSVRGEVQDEGDGEVAIRELAETGPGGGYGLRIVNALADRWAVDEGTTDVWFELRPPER
jgi:anti-sigma regulatory factor (Ser/Thr protein kinase)